MKGPTLTVVASCQGCDHLVRKLYRDGTLRRIVQACAHPGFQRGRWLARAKERPVVTPADCPELHAATVAHARAVLAKEGKRGRDRVLTCADCGDPLNAPTTADECSAKHDGVAPRAPEVE